MGLFDLFKQKKVSNKYVFSDEDRDSSKEIRERKKEIELLKLDRENELHKLKIEKQKLELQQEIEDLKHAFDDEDDDSPSGNSDMDLIKMFLPLLTKTNPAVSAPIPQSSNTSPPSQVQKQSLSDDALVELWEKTPKQYKLASKTMSDSTLSEMLRNQFPQYDDDTLARALKIIRS